MNEQPLVTVVTPSYNQGEFIEETIKSVLSQTYKNVQYIVVDGGSTDRTMEVVDKYKDEIDIVIHEKDKGQSDAINKGFKLAQGKLVGWLNSDDIFYPECVDMIVKLYQKKPDGSIYYNANCNRIDRDSSLIKTWTNKIPDKNYLLKVKYDVIQPGSFYRRDLVKSVNYLDESIHYCMDLDLWLKLLQLAPIHYIEEPPLAAFRVWETSKTTNDKPEFIKNIRQVLLKHGTPIYASTLLKTYWYTFKFNIKDLLLKTGMYSK